MKRTVLLIVGVGAAAVFAVALCVWGISVVAFKGDPGAGIEAAAGLVSLVVAILTFQALKVAQVSAQAAEKAADAALKGAISTQNIERAYLYFRVEDVDWSSQPVLHSIRMINAGKTPAVLRHQRGQVFASMADAPKNFDSFMGLSPPLERVFVAGEVGIVGSLEIAALKFVLVVAAEYTDVFGDCHRTSLVMELAKGPLQKIERLGGRPIVPGGFETMFKPWGELV